MRRRRRGFARRLARCRAALRLREALSAAFCAGVPKYLICLGVSTRRRRAFRLRWDRTRLRGLYLLPTSRLHLHRGFATRVTLTTVAIMASS